MRDRLPRKLSHSSPRKTPRLPGHRLPRKVCPRRVLAGSDGAHDHIVSLEFARERHIPIDYLFVAENGDVLCVPERMLDHARHMPDRAWREEIDVRHLSRLAGRS